MSEQNQANAGEEKTTNLVAVVIVVCLGGVFALCLIGLYIFLWRYTFPVTGLIISALIIDYLFGEKGKMTHRVEQAKVDLIRKCCVGFFLLLMICCPFLPLTKWEKKLADEQRDEAAYRETLAKAAKPDGTQAKTKVEKEPTEEDQYRAKLLPLIKKYYGTPMNIEVNWVAGVGEDGKIERRRLPIINVGLKGSWAGQFDDAKKICRAVHESELGFSYVKIKSGTHTTNDAYGNPTTRPQFLGIWDYAVITRANWKRSPDMRALSTGYILRAAWDVKKPADFDYDISDSKLDDLLDIMQ